MLHAKFEDHQTSGSEEDFYHMGVAAILGMWPVNFHSPFHRGFTTLTLGTYLKNSFIPIC